MLVVSILATIFADFNTAGNQPWSRESTGVFVGSSGFD